MALVGDARVLGGVGSILLLLSIGPAVGGFLAVAGLVLILVAMRKLSKGLGEPSIWNNSVYAVVAAFVGIVVAVLLVVASLLALVGLESLTGVEWGKVTLTDAQVAGFAISFVFGVAAAWVAFVLSALYVKRAADKIAERLAVPMFRTAGTVYLVGAGLMIILVGFALVFVAALLFAVAFFSIPQAAAVAPAQPGRLG
jgi:uncharacterized membrane protein